MKIDADPIAEAFRAAFSTVVEPAVDPPSWVALAERAVEVGPGDPSPRPRFLRRPVAVAAIAAATVLIAIGGALILIRAGGNRAAPADTTPDRVATTLDITTTLPETTEAPDTPTTVQLPARPGAVFEWGDDLSRWVPDDEMTVALESVLGAELDVGAVLRHEDDEWSFGGWRVLVHNGDHDGRYVGPPTETDARLPQGVTYEAEDGFGHGGYILKGPNSDEMIAIHLLPPGMSFGPTVGSAVRAHEDRVFALASMMLREMGWTD